MSQELVLDEAQQGKGFRPGSPLALTVLSVAWGAVVFLFIREYGPYHQYSYLAVAAVVAAVAIAVHIDLNRVMVELDLALKGGGKYDGGSGISEKRNDLRNRVALLGALLLANAHIYALHVAWSFNTCFGSLDNDGNCGNSIGWVSYNLIFGAELWVFLIMHGYLLISASSLQARTVRRTEDFVRSMAYDSINGGQDRLSKILKDRSSREIFSEATYRRRIKSTYVTFGLINLLIVVLICPVQSTFFDGGCSWGEVIAASILFVPLLTFLAVNILQSMAFVSYVRKEYFRAVREGKIEKRASTLWGYTLTYRFFIVAFSILYLTLVWFFYSLGDYLSALLFILPIVFVRFVFWRWLVIWFADPVVFGELKNVDFSSFGARSGDVA